MTYIAWFIKDPDSILNYTFDWDDVVEAGDSIVNSSWDISTDLSITASSYDADTTTVFISGGVLNTRYDVTNRITTANGLVDDKTIQIEVKELRLLDQLVMRLRMRLGDTNQSSYRYLDKWLQLALLSAVEYLQRWWNFKYLVNYTTKEIYRNSNRTFLFAEPSVIEDADIWPIVLMASIIIKNGTLQNSAWDVGSWRDAEISFSNIEASRLRKDSLKDDWLELTSILKPPQKRLANALKGSLPGYLNNAYERNIKDLG